MKKSRTSSRIAVKTGVRAGAVPLNHNGVAVKTGVRAGAVPLNHNGVAVKIAAEGS